jgi:hypothetical protein
MFHPNRQTYIRLRIFYFHQHSKLNGVSERKSINRIRFCTDMNPNYLIQPLFKLNYQDSGKELMQ